MGCDLIELAELRDRAKRASDDTQEFTKEFRRIAALLAFGSADGFVRSWQTPLVRSAAIGVADRAEF